MTIRLLSPETINRIAAGEVVERPASALKELIENAIDAGATDISIKLANGGKSRIAVTDNGCGMSKEELTLAILRHATSKLPQDDLFDIRSMGFRGEALPAIASVSRCTITSRRKADAHGWKISVEGGKADEIEPASAAQGTCVEVADLFYATPARLKFLKSDNAERSHAVEAIEKLALSHPHITFRYSCDGKKPVAFASSLDPLARINAVVAHDFSENAMPVSLERDELKITGFAGLPTYTRATAAGQYLFVNHRPVRDKLLISAVRGAYHDVTPHGRHPVAVLFLEIPPHLVDVNVHPAKTEVRFRDSSAVRHALVSAIRNAVLGGAQRSTSQGQVIALSAFKPQTAYVPSPPRGGFGGSWSPTPPARGGELWENPPTPFARMEDIEPEAEEVRHPLGAARGQLHDTYIIAETEDGMVLIDQHAAHERITLEKMKRELAGQGIARQPLLLPEVIELGETLAHNILSQKEALETLGLVLESFGPGAVVLREVPALLRNCDLTRLIRDLAEEAQEFGEAHALSEKLDLLLANIACKASVKAGRKLSAVEMNALLREMEITPFSGQCNHGRPTYVKLGLSDIEKLFGRK